MLAGTAKVEAALKAFFPAEKIPKMMSKVLIGRLMREHFIWSAKKVMMEGFQAMGAWANIKEVPLLYLQMNYRLCCLMKLISSYCC